MESAAADLFGVDFTDADWFNAVGLTESQATAAQCGTLVLCPPDIKGMHRYLDDRYDSPFKSDVLLG